MRFFYPVRIDAFESIYLCSRPKVNLRSHVSSRNNPKMIKWGASDKTNLIPKNRFKINTMARFISI